MFSLPAGPNPMAELFGPLLQQTGQQIGTHYGELQNKRRNEDAFRKLLEADTPLEQIQAVSSLRIPEKEKLAIFDHLQTTSKREQNQEQMHIMDEALAEIGMPKNLRNAFVQLNTGAQTELLKNWLEKGEREGIDVFAEESITEPGEGRKTNQEDFGDIEDIEQNDVLALKPPTAEEIKDVTTITPDEIEVEKEFKFPKLPSEKGITPKEREARKNQREKQNSDLLLKEREKLQEFEGIDLRIDRLDDLNKSFKLPDNAFLRSLASTDAGLKILQLFGNPETQSFIKTVKDFTVAARQSFGARVTNFELQQFMARLPQLLNTPEGRDIIIQQMKLVNEGEMLKPKSIIDTLQHYGTGEIEASQLTKIADQYIEPKKKQFRKKMKNLSVSAEVLNRKLKNKSTSSEEMMNAKPSPSQHQGKIIRELDEKGNVIGRFRSDGNKWVRIK